MREIKFRAWDGNKFIEHLGLANLNVLNLSSASPFPLQQFTGLHDKNGKEIYDGDIVKGGWNGDVYPVEFTFSWIHQYVEYGREPLEVIGNVYENPDLIKS